MRVLCDALEKELPVQRAPKRAYLVFDTCRAGAGGFEER